MVEGWSGEISNPNLTLNRNRFQFTQHMASRMKVFRRLDFGLAFEDELGD